MLQVQKAQCKSTPMQAIHPGDIIMHVCHLAASCMASEALFREMLAVDTL
jgi:hypothetical protein